MKSFLNTYFSSQNINLRKLKGDGGHRNYYRIQDKENSYVLMDSGLNDLSFKHFIFWQKKLEEVNSPVPRIFKYDLKQGLALLEDLGTISLKDVLSQKQNYMKVYCKALEELLTLQENINHSGMQKFSSSFFKKEIFFALEKFKIFFEKRNLIFPKEFLFKKEMDSLCEKLDELPFTFCHRDYHSQNLMVKNEKIYIIDFQDAGYGPYCYDLTSLIFDSYISLTNEEKDCLITFYLERAPSFIKKIVKSKQTLSEHLSLLFLQRGFKACGCFVEFDNESNKKTHLPFVKPTLTDLEIESEKLSYKNLVAFFKSLKKEFIL